MGNRVGIRAMNLALLLLAFTLSVFSTCVDAQEPAVPVRDVEVRMFLIDVENINDTNQSFTANLTLVMRWFDQGLVHTDPEPRFVKLESIWFPNVQILNQQKLVTPLPQLAEVYPDGKVVYRQRYWGDFSQPLELNDFPFDSQRLTITMASVGFAAKSVKLRASADSGISDYFSIPDWSTTGWRFDVVDLPFDDGTYRIQGMEFSLDVERDRSFFLFKVILPLILIVVMSWLVFWIDPSLVSSQISVSVTAMLTMIAYRFALAGLLPRLNFLTSLDHFVLLSTLAVFLSMMEVIYTAHLSTTGQLERARSIDRKARLIIPLIYIPLAIGLLSHGT